MAKWRYFNPDHWNYLFPHLLHKELRVIEDFIARHPEPARLMERALQGIFPKATFLEIDLYEARPTPDTIGYCIRNPRQSTTANTLKGEVLLGKHTFGFSCKWICKNNIEVSFLTDIRYLLKNAQEIRNGYQVYEHLLQDEEGQWHTYWGITKRTWQKRWQEHVGAANRGSDYLFHKAIRELLPKQLSEAHQVPAVGFTEEDAMNHEEWFVEHFTLYPDNPLGLNMIPGGYAGIRALHKLGIAPDSQHISPEDRDVIIEEFLREHPRKGIANPLISAKWKDENYAISIICGPEGRLSPEQIREIRRLAALGWDAESILDNVGALNLGQVQRVLLGKTYLRIH